MSTRLNRAVLSRTCCASCAMVLLLTAGCYSYNPYGYGGYPEVMSTVPSPVLSPTTAPTPIQPVQPILPGASPIGPQAATPTGVVQPLPTPPTLSTPAATPGAAAPAGKPVPVYQDPTDAADPAKGAAEPAEAGDGATESSSLRTPTDRKIGAAAIDDSAGDVIRAKGEKPVATPGTVVPAEDVQPINGETSLTRVPEINEANFGYDATSYRWFKGTVEFDKTDNAWHLLYAPTPSDNDPYGGDISLADDPRLEALQNNDVIYVTGTLQSGLTDRVGKPRFQIDQLSNLSTSPPPQP